MEFLIIDKNRTELFEKLLPEGAKESISAGKSKAVGALFTGEAAGCALWREDAGNKKAVLLYLYVLPEFRRMGVGSGLISASIGTIIKDGMKDMAFSYQEKEETFALTPFFNACGLETISYRVPMGRVTLKDVAKALEENGLGKVEPCGEAISRMPAAERAVVCREIEELSGESAGEYTEQLPDSYAYCKDGKAAGMLLMHEEEGGVLSLDYLYNSAGSTKLAGMIRRAFSDIFKSYPRDTVVEMMLSTASGERLYERFFGEAVEECRYARCNIKLSK